MGEKPHRIPASTPVQPIIGSWGDDPAKFGVVRKRRRFSCVWTPHGNVVPISQPQDDLFGVALDTAEPMQKIKVLTRRKQT